MGRPAPSANARAGRSGATTRRLKNGYSKMNVARHFAARGAVIFLVAQKFGPIQVLDLRSGVFFLNTNSPLAALGAGLASMGLLPVVAEPDGEFGAGAPFVLLGCGAVLLGAVHGAAVWAQTHTIDAHT